MEDRVVLLKILEKVENIEWDVTNLKNDSVVLNENMTTLNQNISEMKEDFAEVRGGVNQLLDWAEEAQVQVQIPLFIKSLKD